MSPLHFRRRLVSLGLALLAALHLLPASAAITPPIATEFDFSSDTTPGARKFYFETVPGQRYSLWRSTDLQNWTLVAGYPQTATGLSMEHTFAQGEKEFFRVEPIDDQAPTVVGQYPAADGFAVGRFADLNIELADVSDIDPASVRLTVGATGPISPGAPGLTITGNTISYDSGDAALGAWGATISATLVAADTLGHTLTHTWSFRLEPEPQTAANIFVFGSPTAQRAGQRVSGPAAALASRYPAPVGPQRAGDPPPWHIESVLADRILIAYEAGGMPGFTAGQLICNLAPVRESEIFYRRVVSTSNDAVNLKLTVMTSEAALTDFATSGSAAVSENSVIFELNGDGALTKALGGTLNFPRIGYNLSGSKFKLRGDGYEATVAGISYSAGGQPDWLEVTATEYSWWFTPRIRASLELDWSGLKSFEAIASGQVSTSSVFDGSVTLLGVSVERTIYDLPEIKEPRSVIYLGNIGPIPVFATLGFDFSLKSKAEAKALLDFGIAYRQEVGTSFGLSYQRGVSIDWIHSFQASSPDLGGSLALTGEFSFELKLDPRLEFLVYGLAGMKAAFEPSAGVVATASTDGGLIGKVEASLDFALGTAGPAFDVLNIDKELSYNIWEGEWPIGPQNLAFKTHPQSRTVAPGEDVSFTCTVDSPTPPSFQWYHNGRLIPGQTSRSLFLPFVNSGHAGTYYVSVKAGNLAASSESATLTVRSTTPANLDTDGDGIPNLYETNTGIWVSTTQRGTNPYKWDSDGDGLSDGVETNTGVYLSRSNTGTNPNQFDTDGDGINDKREIDLGNDPNPPPVPMGMALIPAGSFTMGQDGIATPVHTVYVSAFYMGKYEVTKEEWDAVRAWGMAAGRGYTDLAAGNGSSASKGANHPVHSITWYDMVKWCNARSQKENLVPCYYTDAAQTVIYKTGNLNIDNTIVKWSANGYRLPTEAEWEKAARGGLSGQMFPWSTDTITHSQANYYAYSGHSYDLSGTVNNFHPTYAVGGYPYSSPVGSFAPNGYGLYDMAGNMWEWCWDRWGSYAVGSQPDPRGPSSGLFRVRRGGGWYYDANYCRVPRRDNWDPRGNGDVSLGGIGVRLARSSVP